MKRCERCMKTIWFWQKKDIDTNSSSEEEEKEGEDIDPHKKIMYYHWNYRYPKIEW